MKYIDKQDKFVTKPAGKSVKTKTSAYGLLVVGNYVLLTQDKDVPFLEIPGGTVEPTETIEAALVREMKEETGLTVTVETDSLLAEKTEPFYNNDTDTYYESTRRIYKVALADNTLDIRAIFEHEIASVGFYHIDTVSAMKLQEFNDAVLKKHILSIQ